MKNFIGESRGWLGVAALSISPGYDDEASVKPTNAELFRTAEEGHCSAVNTYQPRGSGRSGFRPL